MRRATADCSGAGIVNPIPAGVSLHNVFGILLLPLLVFIVTNVEVETHLRVFRSASVEHRYAVVPAGLPGIIRATSFQQQHTLVCFCQASREWTATRARSDYDVIRVSVAHNSSSWVLLQCGGNRIWTPLWIVS